MNCNEYKELIDEHIEGCLEKEQLEQVRLHCNECQECKREFMFASNLGSVLKHSLVTELSVEQAEGNVVDGLDATAVAGRAGVIFRVNKWVAAAACMLIGFGLAQLAGLYKTHGVVGVKVPIKAENIVGEVLVRHGEVQTWQSLKADDDVYLSDTVLTAGKSGVVLAFDDGSIMKLEENTAITLNEFNGKIDFYLTDGKVHSDLRSPHAPFFISTPQGRVEALGTDFVVSVD